MELRRRFTPQHVRKVIERLQSRGYKRPLTELRFAPRNTFGRHVWLRCLDPMAEEVLATHLDELVRLLEDMPAVVIEVRPESLIVR